MNQRKIRNYTNIDFNVDTSLASLDYWFVVAKMDWLLYTVLENVFKTSVANYRADSWLRTSAFYTYNVFLTVSITACPIATVIIIACIWIRILKAVL